MKDVHIVGTGLHPWGKFDNKTFVELGTVAVDNALKDAGVEWEKIQVPLGVEISYEIWRGLSGGEVGDAELIASTSGLVFEDFGIVAGEDYDYWIRVSRITQIAKLATVLSYYRIHSGNITKRPTPINYSVEVIKKNLNFDVDSTFANRQVSDLAVLLSSRDSMDTESFNSQVQKILQIDKLYRA